jgi:hypothetical protein
MSNIDTYLFSPLPQTTYEPPQNIAAAHTLNTLKNESQKCFPGENKNKKKKPNRPCDCTVPHDWELQQFLDKKPGWDRKTACRKWKMGHQVCYRCDCIVNPVDHHLRCSGKPPAEMEQEEKEYEIDGVKVKETNYPVDTPNHTEPPEITMTRTNDNTSHLTNDTLIVLTKMMKEINKTHEICTVLHKQRDNLISEQKEEQHRVQQLLFEPFSHERLQVPTNLRQRRIFRRNRNRQRRGLVGASALTRGVMSRNVPDSRWLLVGAVIGILAGRVFGGK